MNKVGTKVSRRRIHPLPANNTHSPSFHPSHPQPRSLPLQRSNTVTMVSSIPSSWLLILFFQLQLCFGDLANLNLRQSCGTGYDVCAPKGASTRDVPEIGPSLARLYLNLLMTVNPQPARGNGPAGAGAPALGRRDSPDAICCKSAPYQRMDDRKG